ncbi:MAG: bifunctional riboflavin kinase/FAD synthetase [Burkholderiaceae bacterium]|nr:bifunctional riboflavin kinase/FAD synthetase [Burkholderiaceae bacterium]MEB2320809.1 bifunctional riboflavin kinase/FAD synthetase [Pseudomonadota bacterium]
MDIFRRLPPADQRAECALTIGNYDGVHRGHQAVLARLVGQARSRGLASCVLTFEPHPREFFAARHGGEPPARILTERDKLEALAGCGIDRVCIARFDESLAGLSPQAFIDEVIVEGLRTRFLLIGDDFRFGAKRAGDVHTLEAAATEAGYTLEQLGSVTADGERISSSAVRAALAAGDFDRTRELLGRPYRISGHVVHGRKLGRDLGFPTLNLQIAFPRPAVAGVFVVRVHGLGPRALPGVASLGTRPAVETNGKPLLEAHLLGFDRDVYGELIGVEFCHKLRDEANFDSLEALASQIDADVRQARAWHEQHPPQAASTR